MTIWRMSIAGWTPKAINTYTEYLILIAFPLQQWFHERPPMLRYTYTACLVCATSALYILQDRASS